VKTRGAAATPTKAKAAVSAAAPAAAPERPIQMDLVPAEIPDEPHEDAYQSEPEYFQEESDALSSPVQAHEHDGSESTLIDEPQHASAELTDDLDVHAAAVETAEAILNSKEEELAEYGVPDISAEEALEEVVPKPEETTAHEEGVHELPAAADAVPHEETIQAEDHIDTHLVESAPSETDRAGSVTPEGHDADAHVNGKTTPTPGGGGPELEDIINMLEAKPRPMSIATIPDEFDIVE